MPNLQTNFVQFTGKKKPEIVQKTQIELSINSNGKGLKYKLMLTFLEISEICSKIQRLNSYNLLTNKKGKVTWAINRPDEQKLKKVLESWN